MSSDFFDRYAHKVLSTKELLCKIGTFPRKQKIIYCHGVFDVVHPGHIRHLSYAKTKAEILVVSITADKHIKKGIYRPHVPQDLRALNLSAFEMVDYVIIDQYAKPINNLKKIKPDFFAKGFEYSSKGLPIATQEEAKTVEKYGGKMIFTPGDVVYSSSKFLEYTLPEIKWEKLLLLMKNNKFDLDDIKKLINKFSKLHIHVLGDTIVDSYTRTSLIGGQVKTPTLSVLYENTDKYIGGAAIVAQHLKAAGAKVTFSTILGDDPLKDYVVKGLKSSGININPIIDNTRPTINKNVIIVDGYRIIKVDTLDNQPLSEQILKKFNSQIAKSKADAFIFSDFRHGIFNNTSLDSIMKAIPKKKFLAGDSQVATRWGNICDFKNFDLITPNEKEARFALADQDSSISFLSRKLHEKSKFKNLILKLGSRGLFAVNNIAKKHDHAFTIPSFVNNLVDPVGAGDALLSYSTLAMLSTKFLPISSLLGAIAAACECECDGNKPIATKEIIEKINQIQKEIKYIEG